MNSPATNTDDVQQRPLQRHTMNRSSFYMLLFLLVLLFMNSSDDETGGGKRPTVYDVLKSLQNEKEILANVTFGINVTHPLTNTLETKIDSLLDIGRQIPNSHFYHNITGIFRGDWESENTTLPASDPANNQTLQDENRGGFIFTDQGSYSLNLKSIATEDQNVHYIEGYMHLNDAERSNFGALLLAEGIHFLNNGTLYLMAVPEGASFPLADLLHMLPDNETMAITKKSLDQRIDEQIEKLEKMAAWDSQQLMDSDDKSQTASFGCQFQLFGQLHPVPKTIKRSHLIEYEKELEDPQGIRTIRPPPLELSSVMYAPNCGLFLSTKGTGMKIETYYSKAVSYAGMASFLAIVQIFSLIHQMEFTPTPSSVTNVSYWTIVMQAIMDGYLCLLHLTAGIVADPVFIPFSATAFFNFVLVSVFGMRYLLVIWRIQRPEVARAARPRPQPAPQAEEEVEGETPPAVPANATPVREERSNPTYDVGTLYCKLYVSLLVGLFLFYHTATSSPFVQNIVIGIVGLGFYSFWIPQIIRSISRGCRRPLSPKYVIGMSISRLAIPLYFYGCPENVLAHKTTPWIWALVVYMAVQVLILFLQDLLGPRFFVPERLLPQTYNYHPILATEDEETLQGEEEAGGTMGSNSRDCAICMLQIDSGPSTSTGLGVLGRAQYMVTPCHHMFHTDCLEKWMRIKLECPVCRAYLPAC